ncbi:MAG: beta-galactosidase [Armatimonadota bacterium]|nr:beta-galactosidase [Armatimonadota bacterium]MDW8026561.1 beta-galactosidase [Armatimonadota bacterium]
MSKLTRRSFIAGLISGMGLAAKAQESCQYGGWAKMKAKATGFFRVECIDGVWWLVDPDGHLFVSKGVNHVSYRGDYCPALGYSPYHRNVQSKYGSEEKWAETTVQRLRSWGFNTIGAWSSGSLFRFLPYTIILGMGARAGANWLKGTFPDVFSPQFRAVLGEVAAKECAQRKNDPLLVGYFTDNELRWGPDWRSPRHLLDDYLLMLPPDAPGKMALLSFLKKRYQSIDSLNKAWGLNLPDWDSLLQLTNLPPAQTGEIEKQRLADRIGFLQLIAREYFSACHDAIRKHDPNHLILGVRFAGYAPRPVIEAMGEFVDIVSFNTYAFEPPVKMLNDLHQITGRPVMITEFSFKAMDSGLPNTRGAGRPVPTQKDRADNFERFVTALMKLPYCVGYHWFKWSDQPAQGRFDGENSNYGIVKENDEPWEILAQRMTEVNERIEMIHFGKE